jgi:dipeptide/tripeptide permease
LVLIVFFVLWTLVHSLLASLPLENWTRRVFGAGVDRWYWLAFNALAAITILPIFPMLATQAKIKSEGHETSMALALLSQQQVSAW